MRAVERSVALHQLTAAQVGKSKTPIIMEKLPPFEKPRCVTKDCFRWLISQKYPDVTILSTKYIKEKPKGINLICCSNSYNEIQTAAGIEMVSFLVKESGIGIIIGIDKASTDMIKTEACVITEIIPLMEHILQDVSLGKYVPLTSALIDHAEEAIHYNIIEDDCERDFEVVSQNDGLDLKYSLAFMRQLAIFHAASIPVLKKLSPDILKIPLLPDSDAWDVYQQAIKTSISGIISNLESWECGEGYIRKLQKIQEELPKHLAKALRRRPDKFQVLVHGAPCEDRILFRHGDDRLVAGVRLRGFEYSHVGSFADDVLRFIYEATSNDVLESHTDLLVEEYRCAFNDVLETMGTQDYMLSPEAVRRELDVQRAVALVSAFHGLPHTRMPDYLSFWNFEEVSSIVFENPEYSRILRILLPRFNAKGWLDGFDAS